MPPQPLAMPPQKVSQPASSTEDAAKALACLWQRHSPQQAQPQPVLSTEPVPPPVDVSDDSPFVSAARVAASAACAAVAHAAAALNVTLDDYASMVDGPQSERASSRSVKHVGVTSPAAVSPPSIYPSAAMAGKYDVAFAHGAFASVRLEVLQGAEPGQSTTQVVKVYNRTVATASSGRQQMHEWHLANELRLCGLLHHPFIIAPTKSKQSAHITELYMEFAPHGDLESYVTRHYGHARPIPDVTGRAWIGQLLEAISYLHGKQIAHRDVKLENIVLDSKLNARLIDFGAAENVSPAAGSGLDGVLRRVSVLQGTPGYMAPEALTVAAAQTGDYDALAADMWSVGVTLYCLFNAAALPFTGKDIHELRVRVVSHEPPPARHMGKAPRELCKWMMTKAPWARPTAENARRHLWFDGLPLAPAATAYPPVPSSPTPRQSASAPAPPMQAWSEDRLTPRPPMPPAAAPPPAAPASALAAAGRPTGLRPQARPASAHGREGGRGRSDAEHAAGREGAPAGREGALGGTIWRVQAAAQPFADAMPPAVAAARELARGARPTVAELLIRNPQGWRELEPMSQMMIDAREKPVSRRGRSR